MARRKLPNGRGWLEVVGGRSTKAPPTPVRMVRHPIVGENGEIYGYEAIPERVFTDNDLDSGDPLDA